MHERIAARLLALNREFYQTFGPSFCETRTRLQAGVLRALSDLSPQAMVLDLGCGHGLLARELDGRDHRGAYLGLDADADFVARALRQGLPPRFGFAAVDLGRADWSADVAGPFDAIFALAFLHHLPSAALRRQMLRQARSLTAPQGRCTVSAWDFLASARLRARIVPWSAIGLSPADVEPDDHLVDWRRGGRGLRYVHRFEEGELSALAGSTGFAVVETYRSDGENGRLGLYQVWEPLSSSCQVNR